MAIEIGSVAEGTVTGITKFGAFVGLNGGAVGMIHISEVSSTYVTDINQHLKVGDKVNVRVLAVNPAGKYDLSIKQLEKPKPFRKPLKAEQKFFDPFEDKINKFLKQSEEKLFDLKKNIEGKFRSGRPKKKKT